MVGVNSECKQQETVTTTQKIMKAMKQINSTHGTDDDDAIVTMEIHTSMNKT